jgi:hypothetical protein
LEIRLLQRKRVRMTAVLWTTAVLFLTALLPCEQRAERELRADLRLCRFQSAAAVEVPKPLLAKAGADRAG